MMDGWMDWLMYYIDGNIAGMSLLFTISYKSFCALVDTEIEYKLEMLRALLLVK